MLKRGRGDHRVTLRARVWDVERGTAKRRLFVEGQNASFKPPLYMFPYPAIEDRSLLTISAGDAKSTNPHLQEADGGNIHLAGI